ncbi:hypothetical protein [Halobaculum roseum]|uniref:Uncharacterized protein n=1 Tax=Halobaculum roseum TaxID=2175149 RepID=A0ABD5MVT7_9EURY|nr:hypothetical protein [Halobaculum roseum]QZY04503.1 hypothetical protein K6T36_17700 [Halobaculum roseum]
MHDADGGDPGGTDGDGADGRGDESDRTVEELVEYCRVQAGLLAGRVETMAEEASERIDEIDEGIAALRDDLDASEHDVGNVDAPESPETANSVDSSDEEVAALADAEADLQRKQAMVEATESRMRLFQELSTDYLEIADDLIAQLESGEADPDEAVSRVVSFEAERDAPAYFEERETLVEVATAGDED